MNEPQDIGMTCVLRRPLNYPVACYSYSSPVQIEYSVAPSFDALDLSGNTAGWVLEAAKKLEKLGRFRIGWDSYGGLPLKPNAKGLTLRVLSWLGNDELPVPAVVLGSNGTVQLEWKARGKELEVELQDDDTIEFVKVSPNGKTEGGEANVDLSKRLHELSSWFLQL
ncbi:MAG: hypothetical protein ACYC3I_15260 [Gemmataceae bacterium]